MNNRATTQENNSLWSDPRAVPSTALSRKRPYQASNPNRSALSDSPATTTTPAMTMNASRNVKRARTILSETTAETECDDESSRDSSAPSFNFSSDSPTLNFTESPPSSYDDDEDDDDDASSDSSDSESSPSTNFEDELDPSDPILAVLPNDLSDPLIQAFLATYTDHHDESMLIMNSLMEEGWEWEQQEEEDEDDEWGDVESPLECAMMANALQDWEAQTFILGWMVEHRKKSE